MKCRYCDYVPETHYKDGREKAEGMRIYHLAEHMDKKHHAEYVEHERRRKQAHIEASGQERTLRNWGEGKPAMCSCGLTVPECQRARLTLGLAPHLLPEEADG